MHPPPHNPQSGANTADNGQSEAQDEDFWKQFAKEQSATIKQQCSTINNLSRTVGTLTARNIEWEDRYIRRPAAQEASVQNDLNDSSAGRSAEANGKRAASRDDDDEAADLEDNRRRTRLEPNEPTDHPARTVVYSGRTYRLQVWTLSKNRNWFCSKVVKINPDSQMKLLGSDINTYAKVKAILEANFNFDTNQRYEGGWTWTTEDRVGFVHKVDNDFSRATLQNQVTTHLQTWLGNATTDKNGEVVLPVFVYDIESDGIASAAFDEREKAARERARDDQGEE